MGLEFAEEENDLHLHSNRFGRPFISNLPFKGNCVGQVFSKMTELFSDNFTVNQIDPDGRSFDNIQRVVCSNESSDSQLILDVNSQLYEMRVDEVFSLVLSQEFTEAPSDSTHWHPGMLQNSNASKFDYVMYGKVYRYEEDSANHKATVYVSFGGLLMKLTGEQHALSSIPIARNVYLLMREIKS